jgi:hypothetical protein
VSGQHATFTIYVLKGRMSCATARNVIEYVLTHGTPRQGAPGTSPPGWQCGYGYGYLHGDHYESGRPGPNCSRGHDEVQGTQAGYTPAT